LVPSTHTSPVASSRSCSKSYMYSSNYDPNSNSARFMFDLSCSVETHLNVLKISCRGPWRPPPTSVLKSLELYEGSGVRIFPTAFVETCGFLLVSSTYTSLVASSLALFTHRTRIRCVHIRFVLLNKCPVESA
jgi:hypothetical protein